jgi:hypothetical protein
MKTQGSRSSSDALQKDLQADNPYVHCPEIFLAHLSPEQYREKLQIYQDAYEKARAQIARSRQFKPPFEFDMEFGSGI